MTQTMTYMGERFTGLKRLAIGLLLAAAAVVAARPIGISAQTAPPVQTQAGPATPALQTAPATSASLPDHLSDADFWKLESDISEPGGYFRIVDNFTSNENEIGGLFTRLSASGGTGGVYLGVGPEQNLTYIAAVRPAMAFIVDIRRQAVMQHLMF